tara:strand:+ start:609 stop:1472 length:864 start_codon:yes stop_codon:yes gene_type:complete
MKITNYWPTPISESVINLSEECRKALIRVVCKYGENIFVYSDDHAEAQYIKEFEGIAQQVISAYLTEAYNIPKEDHHISARAFGNHQIYGGRTYPHYHNGYDGIMAHYLTVGEEFKLNDNYDVLPLDEAEKIYKKPSSVERQGYYAIQGNTKFRETSKVHAVNEGENYMEKFPLSGSGQFIICDPRTGVSDVFSKKAIAFKPKVGTTLIHPGYLWHETNQFTGNGLRAIIVTMFNIKTDEVWYAPKPTKEFKDKGWRACSHINDPMVNHGNCWDGSTKRGTSGNEIL